MYTKIIAGHDLHEGGQDAVALGRLLADATGAQLVVAGIYALSAVPFTLAAEWHDDGEEELTAAIRELADEANAEAMTFASSTATRGLHDLAEDIGADLVIVGSSRRSKVGQVLAGNVGLTLLQGSPYAVGIAPRGYRDHAAGGLSSVTLGYDGTPEAELALADAIELARAADVRLRIVAVAEAPPIVYGKGAGATQGHRELKAAIEERLREDLERAVQSIPSDVNSEATLLTGDPRQKLIEAGTGERNILLLGSRAYGPMRRVLLGSVSATVMRSALCPVLVHPRGAKAEVATAPSVKAADTR
jgi:nucleotide-binding universal stress UspA family protein